MCVGVYRPCVLEVCAIYPCKDKVKGRQRNEQDRTKTYSLHFDNVWHNGEQIGIRVFAYDRRWHQAEKQKT